MTELCPDCEEAVHEGPCNSEKRYQEALRLGVVKDREKFSKLMELRYRARLDGGLLMPAHLKKLFPYWDKCPGCGNHEFKCTCPRCSVCDQPSLPWEEQCDPCAGCREAFKKEGFEGFE